MPENYTPIDARIQLKIDTEANWIANASSFRPKLGELIIYSPDEEYSSPRFKVGDGSTLLNRLPFSNGDLTMKNDTYSGWYNSDYIPKMGEIIIINSETASEPAQVRIGDGSTLVKDLPAFGGASGSSTNAQKLVNSNGQGLNVATQGNRLVYFKDGIPTASNIYVYKTVPQDAVLTELATETEKGLLAPEEKILLNELSEKAITKDNISSSLPTASETVKGGVMIGENLIIDNGVLSAVIPNSEEIEDATTTASGLMSAEDKIKLNNIEAEANKTIVDSALNSTSTNPVENKVINSAISGLNSLISTSNQSTLAAAENFTKNQIAELIGSAPETLNTLGEIADAMENNKDVVEALDEAIGTKANASDLTATSSKLDLHVTNKNNPHKVSKAQVGLGNVENKNVATIKNEILTEENISALGFIKEIPTFKAPVTSVNGETGDVEITAEKIGALTAIPDTYVTKTYLTNQKYLTQIPAEYVTNSELGDYLLKSEHNELYETLVQTIPSKLNQLAGDSTHRVVTDSQIAFWDNKQTALGYTPADSSEVKEVRDLAIDALAAFVQLEEDVTEAKDLATSAVTVANKKSTVSVSNQATSGATVCTLTINGTNYNLFAPETDVTLLPATSTTLGGVKIGNNISVDSAGLISLSKQNVTDALGYTPPKTDTTYDTATTSSSGLMTSDMVTKLNEIESGANKTIIDSALSSTSTNPVQNKIINSALANKIESTSISSINVVSSLPSSGTSGILYLVRN